MVHKPKHKVHSFKGLLSNGGEAEINLERQNVTLAFRIIKFQIIQTTPGATHAEAVVKVFREQQTSIDAVIDFSNTDLLAAAFYEDNDSVTYNHSTTVIFSNELFSRNVYVTSFHASGHTEPMNYYIELEEVPVGAATLMQLKLAVARKLNLSESSPD